MSLNPNPSQLDPTQIFQRAFNSSDDSLRTDANVTIEGTVSVEISAAAGDNIALANQDGTLFVDVTTVDGLNGLDVNIIGGTIDAINPSIGTVGSIAPLYATFIGAINPSDDLEPLQLDINGALETSTNLTEVNGSGISLGQKTMATSLPVVIASDQSPINVSVNNFSSIGSISVVQQTTPWIVSGTITATNPSVGLTGVTAPTSATEIGAIDANGQLQSLLVDPSGKLLVDSSGTSVVTGTVNSELLGLNAFQTSQYSIGTTAVQLTPTPLTNRSSMSIKIVTTGNNIVYIGNSSAVTTSTGYPLFYGDTLQLDLTPSHVIYAIATATNQTAYVLEIG